MDFGHCYPSFASYSPKHHLKQPHSLSPSSTTRPEMDEARSQADYGHLPTPQTSRSPSARVEPASIAEYQEWPFQGLLKRTRIGKGRFTISSSSCHISRGTSISRSLPKRWVCILMRHLRRLQRENASHGNQKRTRQYSR